jgi:integrase
VFNNHLKTTVGHIAIRDFTTLDAQNLLDEIDRTKNLSHKSLQRIQTGLSAIFTFAKQQNIVQLNPIQGTKVEGRKTKPDRYAYSLKEVLAMIAAKGASRNRRGCCRIHRTKTREILGLQWKDYDGNSLVRLGRLVLPRQGSQ